VVDALAGGTGSGRIQARAGSAGQALARHNGVVMTQVILYCLIAWGMGYASGFWIKTAQRAFEVLD